MQTRIRRRLGRALPPVSLLILSLPLAAQVAPEVSRTVTMRIDSGTVTNRAASPAAQGIEAVVYSRIVHVPGAPWLRLHYDGVLLAGDRQRGGNGSYLRLTSMLDGAVQTQHGEHVLQWRNTSAYFNGDAVLVEILAFPGTGDNRIAISEVKAGLVVGTPETICGPTDDRVLSSDPRVARNQPTGCTSWMIDDCQKCFLTAGHCTGGLQVVQFNVPLSTSSGSIQHPPPSDQYSVDQGSLQGNGGQGTGNDWAYFGVFPNSTTGMTPYQAQGQMAFTLLSSPPAVAGQNIRITGNGSVSSPVSPTWHLVQKTHAGPYASFSGTTVRYVTDTTGGNSGSPVIYEPTGAAIGIHTHGGCNSTGGSNIGTGSNHPGLQTALANPTGVCTCPTLTFTYQGGLPDLLAPGGQTIRVTVGPDGPNQPQSGTGMLHYDAGNGFVTVPMNQITPNVYDATFPAMPCLTRVNFYFSAQTTTGTTYTDPFGAPAQAHEAVVAQARNVVVSYDFNTAPNGWTVQNTALLTGPWQRVVPAGNNGSRRDPPRDFDGSGSCWVTGNGFAEDVDGGPTVLTTEVFDLSSAVDPTLRYARWMSHDDGDDFLVVEISQNGGQSWTQVERVGDSPGWVERTFRLRSLITSMSAVRLRFSVADNPNNSVTEAGLDAFEIFDLVCAQPTYTLFGQGCAGSAGVPALQPQGVPALGTTFQVDLVNLPAGALAYMAIGFDNQTWMGQTLPVPLGAFGLANCNAWIAVDSGVILPVNGGVATWSVALPGSPSLAGLRFFNQGLSIVGGAPEAVSNAGDGVIQ